MSVTEAPATDTPRATATSSAPKTTGTPVSTIKPTAVPTATVPPIGGDIVYSGAYGNTTWIINKNGLLEVKGIGDMYSWANSRPEWYTLERKSKVQE